MTNRAKLGLSAIAAVTAIGLSALVSWSRSAEAASNVPPAALVEPAKGRQEVAVLAGGCFWGVEAVYEHVKGVHDVTSGFAGGKAAGASYEMVSTGTTGKAEAVRISFDPTKVSYAELLRIFFAVVHDPTEVNRQGPDVGPQYRTAISRSRRRRRGSRRPISPSCKRPMCSNGRLPPASNPGASSRPKPIIRTSCARTRPTPTSLFTIGRRLPR
jgi:methionine-S-sulfoxide reductase